MVRARRSRLGGGSERKRPQRGASLAGRLGARATVGRRARLPMAVAAGGAAVSYTHLTLPTICSV
eukprot:6449602-Alexandrium_andersonii.AAC.1